VSDQDLIGVIPAAGAGLRLGLPYPKELYPIIRDNRYKPVAQHVLENMVAVGVEHVVFVINETKHQLIGYFGDGRRFGCRVSYAYQGRERRGTGGSSGLAEALDSAHHLVGERTVVFGMADTIITPVDALRPLLARPPGGGPDLHLGLFHTDAPQRVGAVEHDEGGRVTRIVDKETGHGLTEMWGCIVWRPRFTSFLHERVADSAAPDFATIMNEALARGFDVRATRLADATYTDVGTYEEISSLEDRQSR
jgi:glucose-1-phosphate thymidylyltransferase